MEESAGNLPRKALRKNSQLPEFHIPAYNEILVATGGPEAFRKLDRNLKRDGEGDALPFILRPFDLTPLHLLATSVRDM